jgi:hypothetical protein
VPFDACRRALEFEAIGASTHPQKLCSVPPTKQFLRCKTGRSQASVSDERNQSHQTDFFRLAKVTPAEMVQKVLIIHNHRQMGFLRPVDVK